MAFKFLHQAGLLFIFTLCHTKSSALLNSSKQQYTIAGWISSPKEIMFEKWRLLLENYLTDSIGPLYDPPISFKLISMDYSSEDSPDVLVPAGQLDFAYTVGGGLTCLEAQYGYTIFGTQVQLSLGQESTSYGSVIFSLQSNKKIQNVSDFRGKRIGVGHPWAAGTYQLATEVVFYNYDNEAMLNGLIRGHIDLAVLPSGWLEAHYPQNVPLMRYHGIVNITYQGAPYPFPTTTSLIPTYGIAAAPNIPLTLQNQVFDALNNLNGSHPASKAAGIVNFVLPASYEPARVIVEEHGHDIHWHTKNIFSGIPLRLCRLQLGLLVSTPIGKARVNIFESVANFVSCPQGYMVEEDEAREHGCRRLLLDCPEGYLCVCKPCHPDIAVTIFPWQMVLGLCCALFATGLSFSLGWTCLLHSNHRIQRIAKRLSTSIPVMRHPNGGQNRSTKFTRTDLPSGLQLVASKV